MEQVNEKLECKSISLRLFVICLAIDHATFVTDEASVTKVSWSMVTIKYSRLK